MSEQPALLVERDGHVVTLTMNRPEARNALNPEMICRLADAWDQTDADENVRVVILTGSNGHFCAGADLDKLVTRSLKGLPPESDWEQRIRDDYQVIFRGLLRSRRTVKPLIAAIEGSCIAGGVEILQATDIRVAGEGAKLGVSEVRWGLFPQGGSTTRLPRQIPFTRAMEVLLTGDHYSAAEALDMGMIGRVVPDGTALEKAREIAARIAENGPVAVRNIKRAVLEAECMTEDQAREVEMRLGMEVFGTEDAKEGPRAFKEKRKPAFKGR
ncbi:MAG TPA: crotonase/enoyl-CoA hydratase family protein [Candidatus Binatia bacterium]|nr:crotonase/enoyl-CoA hydratase family protein [Candidatus Binatia bacterium]